MSAKYAMLTSPMHRNALLMHIALVTPGNHVVVGVGEPGIGKTAYTRAVASAIGVDESHFLRWSVGQHGPEDFNGWPVPRPDGLHFEAPFAVRRINDGKPALWMLDEMSLATRTTQGAMLRLLDERYCGDERLGDSVKMVGMMNPPEHAADAQDISKPLANRSVWFSFASPSKDDHVAYELGAREVSVDLPKFDAQRWSEAKTEIVGIYSGFMQTRGVLNEDANDESVMTRFPLAYATPRSWSYALNIAATCRMFGDEPAMMELMSGTIGRPQAMEFMAYYKTMDLVPPKDAVADPSKFEVDKTRPDRTFAQLAAVSRYCTEKRESDKEAIALWHGGWSFIEHLLGAGCPKDLLLPAAQHLAVSKPKGQLLAKFLPTITMLAPMVAAAGLVPATAKK